MNEVTITLIRLAIAVLVTAKSTSLTSFVESFRTVEGEVLRGRPDVPGPPPPKPKRAPFFVN